MAEFFLLQRTGHFIFTSHNLLLYLLEVECFTFYFYSSRFFWSYFYFYSSRFFWIYFYFYSSRKQIYLLQLCGPVSDTQSVNHAIMLPFTIKQTFVPLSTICKTRRTATRRTQHRITTDSYIWWSPGGATDRSPSFERHQQLSGERAPSGQGVRVVPGQGHSQV